MPLTAPQELNLNPLKLALGDIRAQRSATVPFPPGEMSFSMARTRRFHDDPLPILLESYARYGPVFTLRYLHLKVVFLIGPEANHYVYVSNAANFTIRESHFREVIPLVGDALFTTDGEFTKRVRRIMVPAFHRDQLERSVETIVGEAQRALGQLHDGDQIDFSFFVRRFVLRSITRVIFALDPDGELARRVDVPALFERAQHFFSYHPLIRNMRGPGTPWARMRAARAELDSLIYAEIARRRESGKRDTDALSLLINAQGDGGAALTDRQIRDEVMSLHVAGHDATTSALAFMFYELARAPELTEPLLAEQERVLGGGDPAASIQPAHLGGDALPELELVIDETLRKYPIGWIGPRRSLAPFEFCGHVVPGGVYVNTSPWATHHLPDLYEQPDRFIPQRMTPEFKATLPKGAYVPFGGGSRSCIGGRFAQLAIRTFATLLISRFQLELPRSFELSIGMSPTILPRGGLPVTVRERVPPRRARTAPRRSGTVAQTP